MMKLGFTRSTARWIGELIPRRNLNMMKAESSFINIVSEKCATLVHIKTPNSKSINMPAGGNVVIIRVDSWSLGVNKTTPPTIEPNTQIEASRR